MILPLKEKKIRQVEIDLTGPDGNVFNLMSIGTDLCELLNQRRAGKYLDVKEFQREMIDSDYEHAVKTMEKYFGHMIIMYR